MLNYVNTVLVSDVKIANEQAKRIQNSLRMRASVFLKQQEIIDFNVYSLLRVYNKSSKKTYTVEIEKPIDDETDRIWASCNCPDFLSRIAFNAWNIPCKHIYRSLFSLKNDTYIDLVNRRVFSMSPKKSIKINYLDIECPRCKQRAIVEYSKICSILLVEDQKDDARYICESCYHAF